MDGYRWREDRMDERAAWVTAYLLKPYDKDDQITPAKLLGREVGSQAFDSFMGQTGDAYEEVMRKQRER